jgi:ABC-type transport system involved in cytochrome c biogenesis permease subunit
MNEKFPITRNVITILNIIAVLILIVGGLLTIGAIIEELSVGALIGVGTLLSAIIPAFLAEMMKVILEIEKNTRKE